MALYHKYRPQNFAEVTGQEHIVHTIKNQIKSNKLSHAYLFSGPRGVGKTTIARILAKAVNCPDEKNPGEPDNTLESAKEISESRSIDVIEIDAASHTGVDNVRENIIDNAQFKPTTLKYKVFIIDEVHMLSTSAFNALLKTLEEPPSYVIFVLATTELHKLPETIISRCQRFDFKKVAHDTMKKHLESVAKEEGVKIDKDVLDRVINKSDGCVRDAMSLLDQLMATGEKKITTESASLVLPTSNIEDTFNIVKACIEGNTQAGLETINKIVEEGVNLPQFGHDIIEILRFLLLSQANQTNIAGLDLSDNVRKELVKLSGQISPRDLIALTDIFTERRKQIKSAPLPQLPLEMGIIEWTNRGVEATSNVRNNPLEKVETKPEPQKKTEKIEESVKNDESVIDAKVEKKENEPVEKVEVVSEPENKLEPKKSTISEVMNLDMSEVESKWSNFLSKLEADSPSLAFIFKSAGLESVNGNIIKLSVEYSFHQDKINDANCKQKVEGMLEEILGGKVALEVEVNEAGTKRKEDKELDDLAAAFGGQVLS